MDARVFALLDGLTDFLGISGIFLICFALSFMAFLVCLLLTLIKSEYSVKNRLWLVVSVGFALIIDLAFTIYLRATALFLLILFATDVLFVGVSLLLPKKQGVYSKESLSLAGLLSKKARESEDENMPIKRATTERIRVGGGEINPPFLQESLEKNSEKVEQDLGLDFSHVKNVIERLNCFGLSQSDKRQVKELETVLLRAENGECGENVK